MTDYLDQDMVVKVENEGQTVDWVNEQNWAANHSPQQDATVLTDMKSLCGATVNGLRHNNSKVVLQSDKGS